MARGLAGLLSLTPSPGPALASPGPGSHETMHRMMDAMHGPGTAARMHRVQGAEQMMDACAAMIEMIVAGVQSG